MRCAAEKSLRFDRSRIGAKTCAKTCAEACAEARSVVHRRAAKWFEDQGDLPEAVKQALAAGEMTEAARLIDAVVPQMFLQSERELATLRNWLESLPDEILRVNGNAEKRQGSINP